MALFNIYRAPKPKVDGKQPFWKQVLMIILSTTISLILTVSVITFIEHIHRVKDRHLTALMVMSNIEVFAQQLDSIYVQMDKADTASTWLLTRPEEKFALLPEDQLREIVTTAYVRNAITYDKSTENIFSNNIDTWKNLGNFQFIDNVGKCFSMMRLCEEMWNGNLDDIKTTTEAVAKRNANSPDKINPTMALVLAPAFRRLLKRQHMWRNWLRCSAEELRYLNRQNMVAIGIDEQEVMDFLKTRQQEINAGVEPPDDEALSVEQPDSCSLTTYSKYDSLINIAAK